jgi:hypothetical protein
MQMLQKISASRWPVAVPHRAKIAKSFAARVASRLALGLSFRANSRTPNLNRKRCLDSTRHDNSEIGCQQSQIPSNKQTKPLCAEEREILQSQSSMRQHRLLHGGVAPKKPLARLAVTSPFVLTVDGSSPDPLDSSEQQTPSDGLAYSPLQSRCATQNHANRRILRQYALRRLTACLVNLTAIPDGHCRNSVGPDR